MTVRVAAATGWLVLVGSVAAACATVRDADALLGVQVRADVLEITVVSTGCTRADDFVFDVERIHGSGAARLTVVRTRADLCRKMPEAATFRYPLADVGLDPGEAVQVQNVLTSIKPRKRR